MNFSRLTIGKDLSHTQQRSMNCSWKLLKIQDQWFSTSLTLALMLIQTNGRLPISPRGYKGRYQTPFFSVTLCSQGIFSLTNVLFMYPEFLIKTFLEVMDLRNFL